MLEPKDDKWDEFHDREIVDWKRVRSALEHENLLTNHRLTWLLTCPDDRTEAANSVSTDSCG